jgi:hypothetical protein
VPPAAEPVLLALAAGVLAQAARISLNVAIPGAPAGRRPAPRTAGTVLAAAAVTALALRVAG